MRVLYSRVSGEYRSELCSSKLKCWSMSECVRVCVCEIVCECERWMYMSVVACRGPCIGSVHNIFGPRDQGVPLPDTPRAATSKEGPSPPPPPSPPTTPPPPTPSLHSTRIFSIETKKHRNCKNSQLWIWSSNAPGGGGGGGVGEGVGEGCSLSFWEGGFCWRMLQWVLS